MQKTHCVFCDTEAVRGREVFRNNLAWAFLTNIPIVPGHMLICPIRCVASFDELTEGEVKAIFDIRDRLQKALVKTFGAEGFNYAWNEGALAGQNVQHFHLHMLPRKVGDTGIDQYEPRKFLYRPGSREASPESELKAVSKIIKKEIK